MLYDDACHSDNVYSIMAVYGLALAYRRVDDDQGRACKCLSPCFLLLDNRARTVKLREREI